MAHPGPSLESPLATAHWWAARLLQVGRETFRDNLNIFRKKLLVDTNCIFLEKDMNYQTQKCIIVAFHPRNAPICYFGFHKLIAIVGSTNPRQVRGPRVTCVRTRRSTFHASVASFFVRLADRCACCRTRSFRFCSVKERL